MLRRPGRRHVAGSDQSGVQEDQPVEVVAGGLEIVMHDDDRATGVSEFTNSEQLMYVAVRLWTSAEQLGGRELCSILNEVGFGCELASEMRCEWAATEL